MSISSSNPTPLDRNGLFPASPFSASANKGYGRYEISATEPLVKDAE